MSRFFMKKINRKCKVTIFQLDSERSFVYEKFRIVCFTKFVHVRVLLPRVSPTKHVVSRIKEIVLKNLSKLKTIQTVSN